MEGHHHRQSHQEHHASNVVVGAVVGDTRFPQWSIQETKEFLMIRSELDRNFMETKRNRLLWDVIASRMEEKGYNRSSEQCKCKWKNLVTRYKGCETMEAEAVKQQQFPFFNEMQAIFAARLQTMLWAESKGGGASSSKKKTRMNLSSEEEEENEESDQREKRSRKKRRKSKTSTTNVIGSSRGSASNIKEILEDFMRQQMQIENQWREEFESREKERIMKEMEWRKTMEALMNERIMMDRRWREKEEQRRMREEARAEKRDALITALLNKLTREDHK